MQDSDDNLDLPPVCCMTFNDVYCGPVNKIPTGSYGNFLAHFISNNLGLILVFSSSFRHHGFLLRCYEVENSQSVGFLLSRVGQLCLEDRGQFY